MTTNIPLDLWKPISLIEIQQIFTDAPFAWGLAGGYAIEQFLGKAIREHGDVDVVVFRDTQMQVHRWLRGWQLYAADPP
jgi:hypothetical protein